MGLYKHRYRTAEGTKLSDHWYFRFNRNGKTYTGSTGTSNKTKAAQFEDRKKQEVNEAKDIKSIKTGVAFRKYGDALPDTAGRDNILVQTRKLLGNSVDTRTLKPIRVFGFDAERDFHTLTMADAQQLVNARRAEGKADSTILTELSCWSQTIKMIDKLGFDVPNIDFAALKKDNGIKAAKHRLRWLSREEEAAFLHQLDPNTPVTNWHLPEIRAARQDAHDLAVLYLNMGPRYNEFASLRWSDVNMRKREIGLYRTKTDNESTLYMPDVVYAVFERRHATRRNGQVYVFESKDKEGHRKYATRAFDSAYRRAGITDASIHTMRHTFAAKFVQNGGSLYELQQLLGHSSPETTQIYAHLAPNQGSIRAAKIMNALNQ